VGDSGRRQEQGDNQDGSDDDDGLYHGIGLTQHHAMIAAVPSQR
jgi:hypothetical protein